MGNSLIPILGQNSNSSVAEGLASYLGMDYWAEDEFTLSETHFPMSGIILPHSLGKVPRFFLLTYEGEHYTEDVDIDCYYLTFNLDGNESIDSYTDPSGGSAAGVPDFKMLFGVVYDSNNSFYGGYYRVNYMTFPEIYIFETSSIGNATSSTIYAYISTVFPSASYGKYHLITMTDFTS